MPQRFRARALALMLITAFITAAASFGAGAAARASIETGAPGVAVSGDSAIPSRASIEIGAPGVAVSGDSGVPSRASIEIGAPGVATSGGSGITSQIVKLRIKGDFRLRYQYEKEGEDEARNRMRIRFRLAGKARVADRWKVGFRFATGGDDPRSTNQTLDGSFSTPDMRFDYAYVMFSPNEGLSLWGGKFGGIKHAVFRPTDLLWDSDINPEGAGAILRGGFKSVKLFGNLNWWILDENRHGKDPMMFAVQPGAVVSIGGSSYIKVAAAYYSTRAVKGSTLEYSAGTNTLASFIAEGDTTMGLAYDFDTFAPSFELGLSDLFDGALENLSFFGDYVRNIDADSLNTGYSFGVKAGHKKVSKAGEWQLKYIYRRLERDAWLDIFPDSDSFGGRTGVRGSEAVLELGFARDAALVLDYYRLETIDSGVDENLLQVDTVFRF